MSDIVTRLQIKAGVMEMGERIAWGSDTSLMREAADTIEALRVEVENADQRLDENWITHQQIIASQAREKGLREALVSCDVAESFGQINCIVEVALSQPTDDSALRSAIQHGIAEFLDRTEQYVTNDASRNAALAAERERCASVCLDIVDGQQYAEAIRALGDK